MRLREKLFLANLAVLLLTMALVGWYAFGAVSLGAKNDTLRRDSAQVRLMLDGTMARIDNIRAISGLMSRYRGLLSFISDADSDPDAESLMRFRSDIVSSIENYKTINPGIANVRLYAKPGFRYELWPTVLAERRLIGQDWLEDLYASPTGTLWRFDHPDIMPQGSGIPARYVSLYAIARYPGQAYVGVLEVSAELAEVFAEVFAADGNHDGAKLALCGDGRIFCDERDGLLAPAMPGRESLLALVRSRVSRGGESGQFELKESAGHYLVSYAALGQFDVYLVSLSDMSPLDAAIQKERLRVMAMVTAVFALLLLAIYALTGALLRRLDLTVARSRQVAAGDLYASFQMPGNDEISELSGHIHAMMDKIRELFALSERRNLAAREAQMRSFYSQINAHFIYNTLENIKMMAEVDGQFRVADSLSSLGRLLRYSLKWDSQYVGVSQEIAHIRNYLALVSLRFEFRISFVASVDADAERYFILKMLLQPLVENAVKHGLEPVGRDGTIELIVARADGRLRVELRDNGAGLSPENLSRLNRALSEGELGVDAAGQEDRGIGLTNIRRRLALQYAPGEYGFTASETDGGGLTLSLELPLITALDGSREDHESVSG